MNAVLLGTRDGVRYYDGTETVDAGLHGKRVSAVYATRSNNTDIWLAGTYEDGIYRSVDHGAKWSKIEQGLTVFCFRIIMTDPLDQNALLCGTEPGRIFRSTDLGQSWNELEGVTALDGIDEWYLPYSPRAGAVRNIFHPPGDDKRLLAAVEVGGLLNSDDGGNTWSCHRVTVDSDIHFVTGHPVDTSLLFAALGYAGMSDDPPSEGEYRRGGVARSRDGGRSWTKLFTDYTRAVIVPSSNPNVTVAAPAPFVGREGRIEISRDDGESWTNASSGLETPMPDMVEVFLEAPDGDIWGICSGGRLIKSNTSRFHWEAAIPDAGDDIQSVAFIAS